MPCLLSSLLEQTIDEWRLLVRDDGSYDNSLEILKKFQSENKNVNILASDSGNVGVKKSFTLLIGEALKYEDCDYLMFCDQDDLWLDDKIEKTFMAMKKLEQKYPQLPLLVHTDLIVTDEKLATIDNSFWNYEHIEPSKNSLNRLLIQNTITGCSMMINTSLASMSKEIPNNSIMHDWWLGLVATEFGKVYFIKDSTIRYRQHSDNDTGAKEFNYINILKKFIELFLNDNLYIKHRKNSIAQAKEFLHLYENKLNKETKIMLVEFVNIEDKSFLQRKKIILKYKLFKQGLVRNIGMLARI